MTDDATAAKRKPKKAPKSASSKARGESAPSQSQLALYSKMPRVQSISDLALFLKNGDDRLRHRIADLPRLPRPQSAEGAKTKRRSTSGASSTNQDAATKTGRAKPPLKTIKTNASRKWAIPTPAKAKELFKEFKGELTVSWGHPPGAPELRVYQAILAIAIDGARTNRSEMTPADVNSDGAKNLRADMDVVREPPAADLLKVIPEFLAPFATPNIVSVSTSFREIVLAAGMKYSGSSVLLVKAIIRTLSEVRIRLAIVAEGLDGRRYTFEKSTGIFTYDYLTVENAKAKHGDKRMRSSIRINFYPHVTAVLNGDASAPYVRTPIQGQGNLSDIAIFLLLRLTAAINPGRVLQFSMSKLMRYVYRDVVFCEDIDQATLRGYRHDIRHALRELEPMGWRSAQLRALSQGADELWAIQRPLDNFKPGDLTFFDLAMAASSVDEPTIDLDAASLDPELDGSP